MCLTPWKRLSESIVFKNPWWSYKRDTFQLPSGKSGEYHYVHTKGSSMVIPVLGDGRFLLVNQYRYLVGRESIEFPCGSVNEDSSYDETAWRELAEETGYSAKHLFLVGEFNPYNGVTDEMCHVYVGRDLHQVGAAPDETEEFELITLSAEAIDQHIRKGTIWDGMTIAGWMIARPTLGLTA